MHTTQQAIDAAFGELLTTCAKTAWIASQGEKVLAREKRPSNMLLAHKTCEVVHEPLGVVCACVSWNYPAHNVLGPLLAALFAGNSIVIKCSENVAWSSCYFIMGVRACLLALQLDPELVQFVVCYPPVASVLTEHAEIKHITFIGSEEVGRKVAQAATKELTPVTLELGGKDPAILLHDADLKYFHSTFLRACFQAVGQNCIGIERFIVSDRIVNKLVKLVEPRIKALNCGSFMDDTPWGVGPPRPKSKEEADDEALDDKEEKQRKLDAQRVDCGAMITDARFDHLEELIQDAVKQGATLHAGGKRYVHPKWTKGHYFQPTLISGVTR